MENQNKLVVFEGKPIRKVWYNDEWYFSVIDVIEVLTDSKDPKNYWSKLKERDPQTLTNCQSFKMLAADGKMRKTDCANTAGVLRTITTRKQLTDEWKDRGVKEGHEFSILTATIAKGTFGLTPSEHSQFKSLEKQNLRDHMTPLELILTSFGEEVTRQITISDEAQGFNENHEAASKGGQLAGQARRNVENQLKRSIVSSDNFLGLKNKEDEDKPLEIK